MTDSESRLAAESARWRQLDALMTRIEADMRAAAANLEFEKAATLRDQIKTLRQPGLALAGVEAPGA